MENSLLKRVGHSPPAWGCLVPLPYHLPWSISDQILFFNLQLHSKSHFWGIWQDFSSSDISVHMSMPLWTPHLSSGVPCKCWVLPEMLQGSSCSQHLRLCRAPLAQQTPFGVVELDPKQTHLWSLCRNPSVPQELQGPGNDIPCRGSWDCFGFLLKV